MQRCGRGKETIGVYREYEWERKRGAKQPLRALAVIIDPNSAGSRRGEYLSTNGGESSAIRGSLAVKGMEYFPQEGITQRCTLSFHN